MEAGDPPLTTSWAPRAFALFRDELLELEELSVIEATTLQTDLEQLKAQTTAEAVRLFGQNAGLPKYSTASHLGGNAGGAASPATAASNTTRRSQKTGKDKGPESNHATASVRQENMIEARTNELVAQYERQPWRRLYQEYQSQLESVQAAVEPVRVREGQEFAFFSARAAESYTLDDVLDATRHRSANEDNQTALGDHSGGAAAALAASANSLSPVAARGRRPSTAPSGSALSVLSCRSDDGATDDFIIDAVGFARTYNETLTATYGYKPVLGTDLPAPSAAHSAWAEDASTLRAALDQHRPGLDTVPSDFCLKTFPPPGRPAAATTATTRTGPSAASPASRPLSPLPPASGTAGSRRPYRADGSRAAPHEAATTRSAADGGGGPLSMDSLRLPSLAGLVHGGRRAAGGGPGGDESSTTSTTGLSSGRTAPMRKAKLAGRHTAATGTTATAAAAAAAPTDAATTVRERLAKAPKVECSAKDDLVVLATATGQEVRQTIRFTNRAPHRMRFKVKPSSHAWLRYTCTQIAPVPGGAASTAATAGSGAVAVETPLSTGGYIEVEVVFDPANTSEPKISAVLEVGIAREVNARSGEGAQWDFYPVTVRCSTVLPTFALRQLPGTPTSTSEDEAAAALVTRCAFPYTFVLARSTLHYQLENTGSTAYVRLVTDSDEFLAEPGPTTSTLLPHGDTMDLSVTFAPHCEGRCRGRLQVEVREDEQGPVLAKHAFEVRGEAVLPHVHLHRLDDVVVDTSGHPQWQVNPEEGPARLTLENTTPGVPKTIRVVVTNDSPVPLPFEWVCEANNIDAGAPGCATDALLPLRGDDRTTTTASRSRYATELAIVPASGNLAANAETVFEATVTAHSVFPLLTSWCLYLKGLPTTATTATASSLSVPPPEVLALYARPKLVPSARAQEAREGTDPSTGDVLPHEGVDAYADPAGAFTSHLIPQPAVHLDKVFSTGFFATAHPVVPSAVLVPSCLEEAVDCLVHYENVRRVTLKNHSPRTLHFVLDPSQEECRGWCTPSPWRFSTRGAEEPDVQVTFTPRVGTVPPFGSATITVRFAVHTVGPHHLEVSCFIPEIMAYTATSGAARSSSPRPSLGMTASSVNDSAALSLTRLSSPDGGLLEMSGEGTALPACSHAVSLHVTGVGASVHTSTEFLDFGLIEEGHEAEASFTVTNDNPIPITFDLLDPMMRDPPRFVFIPPMFRLSAGDSVEVTVYRKGVAAGDAQTFFELCVRDGATLAIETRATIESATLMLEEAVLQHGTVPENVWQEQILHVTNTSALDAPFTVEMAFPLPTPHIDVAFTAQHMVRAGQTHYPVPIRTRFRHRPKPSAEEREAGVDRYRTLLAIRSVRTNRALLVEVRCEAVERLAVSFDVLPTGHGGRILSTSTEQYVRALLHNEVVVPALAAITGVDVVDDSDTSRALQAYCPPVCFTTTLPEAAPVSRETFVLCLTNHTGCASDYHVHAERYAPLPVEVARAAKGLSHAHPSQISLARSHAPTSHTTAHTTTTTVALKNGGAAAAATKAEGSAVPMLTSTKRAFWTTALDGTEQRERERRVEFATAQQLLRDGRGCATRLEEHLASADGALHAYAALQLPFVLLANLPGRYEEMLHVTCGPIAPVRIPLCYEVRGCPVLIDPTTSGLTRVDGLDVLVMPSVIASVASSRRAVRVMNRVPRDLNVSVESFITASTFEVVSVEDDVEAAQVVLKLAPLTAASQRRERERKGHTFVSPARFFLPAMSSKEVIVEYTPSLTLVKDVLTELDNGSPPPRKAKFTADAAATGAHGGATGVPPSSILTSSGKARGVASAAASGGRDGAGLDALAATEAATATASDASDSDTSDDDDDRVRPAATQEIDWHGSLVIQAEIAESTFNDAFLIDEFYFLHADMYPSVRRLGRDTLTSRAASTATTTALAATQTSVAASERVEGEACPAWAKSVVRSVPMLDVQKPLRSRPGRVLRQSRPLLPTQAEQFLLDRELHRLGLTNSSPSSPSHAASATTTTTAAASHGAALAPHSDEDMDSSSTDESEGMANVPLLDAAVGETRPVLELLAEHEERLALEAYLDARREAVRLESTQYFMPLELRLRARCGVPRLAVQPSASGVFFPPYAPDQPCLRTIRLTNRNSAALFFQLSVSVPEYFRVVSATLVPSGIEDDPLVEEDEESKLGLKAAKALKWSDTADQKRAAKLLKSGQDGHGSTAQRSAIVTLSAVPQSTLARDNGIETLSPLLTALKMSMANSTTSSGLARGDGETAHVANPVYCLRGSDALDVTVEVVNAMHFARKAETRHAVLLSTAHNSNNNNTSGNSNSHTVSSMAPTMALPPLSLDAILSIQFLQTSVPRPPVFTPGPASSAATEALTTSTSSPRSPSKRPVRALTTHDVRAPDFVEQTVPLCMYFSAVVVSSAPSLVWFKPGQSRHDGRPQPAYAQRLTLFNHTRQPVTYQLVAVSAQQSFTASSRQAVMGSTAALTAGRKLHEVTNLPSSLVGEDGAGTLLVDTDAPFTVSPMRGVIPAASRGGEPGVTIMHATFAEHSNVRYESAYRVLINGTLSECTFLLRGDSRESEV